MESLFAPALATLALFACGACLGILPVRKLIQVREAKHELRQGSAGAIRTIGGWIWIVAWLMAVWFCATIIGDWGVTGDLEGAFERGMLRLRILLEILAALSDN